jgi:hypothetical protein
VSNFPKKKTPRSQKNVPSEVLEDLAISACETRSSRKANNGLVVDEPNHNLTDDASPPKEEAQAKAGIKD